MVKRFVFITFAVFASAAFAHNIALHWSPQEPSSATTPGLRYVDPDATGTGDGETLANAYTSLSAWVTGEAGDYGGLTPIVEVHSSSGTADTTLATLSGFSNFTGSITIRPYTGNEALKTGIDTNRYRFSNRLIVNQAPVLIQNVQFVHTGGFESSIDIDDAMTDEVVVEKNYIEYTGSATSGRYGIRVRSYFAGHRIIRNNIITGFSGTTSMYGIRAEFPLSNGTDAARIYHNTIYDCRIGMKLTLDGISRVVNNLLVGCTDCFDSSGSGIFDYNGYDEGADPGSNGTDLSSYTDAQIFSDASTGDFALAASSPAIAAGDDAASNTDCPTDDIDGDSRDASTPDLGIHEY